MGEIIQFDLELTTTPILQAAIAVAIAVATTVRKYQGDVNALIDAVAQADTGARVCQLDMMGENTVGLTKVRYAWQHATYGYVAGNCSAEDVTKLTYALAAQYQKAYAPFGCTELVLAVSDPHKCKWPQ